MSGGPTIDVVDVGRALPVSDTVTAVHDRILTEILTGRRPPGSTVRDLDVPELGVSRTPVREALLLLRTAGVLEVVASRYTRVAIIDRSAAQQLFRVWVRLFGLVLDELLGSDIDLDPERLAAEHATTRRSRRDQHAFVLASGRFFDLMVSRSRNPHLVRAIDSVVHAVRLATLSHAAAPQRDAVLRVQEQLVDAVRARDAAQGRATVAALVAIGDAAG